MAQKNGRLDGLVTVVTGAASGLGMATAKRFADEGAHVILGDVQEDKVRALASELGGTGLFCDVTVESDIERLVACAMERHGKIGCMINNAGQLGVLGSVTTLSRDAWDRTIAILLTSVFLGIKHAGKAMAQAGDGVILSTTSVAGIAALGPHAYTAAKHAVVGLTRSAAAEFAGRGVRVNAVAPGNVPTRMTELAYGDANRMRTAAEARNPLRRVVSAEEIAGAFAYLAGPDGRNVTGQILTVDAGLADLRLDASYYDKPMDYFGVDGRENS